jgi:hypothetical protein
MDETSSSPTTESAWPGKAHIAQPHALVTLNVETEPALWDNDLVQFARLISEMQAEGCFTAEVMAKLVNATDLSALDICALIDRADVVFQQTKSKIMSELDTTKAPEAFSHLSVDEVAECVEGITTDTYQELWKSLEEAHKAGTAKPLGGDGSDGTIEEPVITSGSYGSDLVAAWPKLSEAARRNICEAAAKMEAARAH